mgnify:CR=1 FL=1
MDFEEESADDGVAGFVALYQEYDWLEFLRQLQPMIDHFVARFQEIADAGPAEDQDVLQSMVRHEESFVHWIDRELAGEEGGLNVALEQLQFPLPAP